MGVDTLCLVHITVLIACYTILNANLYIGHIFKKSGKLEKEREVHGKELNTGFSNKEQ